ncbi:Methyltransferase type 12 [Chthoniobacter flavus Ellin428]|uniref:Methyltransferase type 12 n=1 Tax=Chthoniobacter flavus Ellin428 TaxID=497964 RepID=B4CW94_9BACT|nr:class I SAM-dependent methyltransferase [Chthoniobacter flavus]EDY21686.1 Methyltransferase type 12 [Chthoniobacter flavus Ellin428]TCO95624.1 methyltransferase family protein [Chthoniobacter flavus]
MIAERIAEHFEGRWLQGYARGKLRRDPVFAAAFDLLKDSPLPVLDVGCGIGLFEFYARERGFRPPLLGVDFDAGKIAKAQHIAGRAYADIQFKVGDVLSTGDFRGHVVLFDVLHYLPAERQTELLKRLIGHVAPGALCLIRATPRDTNWRFRVTQVQEFLLRASSWMKSSVRHYATGEEIAAPFRERGFTCETYPLWGRTPFNSHFFVFRAPG